PRGRVRREPVHLLPVLRAGCAPHVPGLGVGQRMAASFARAPRGPIPWGLLGMVGLIIAVESFVARHDLDFTPWGSAAWSASPEAARREAPSCEVLCFGDSLVKLGVLPRVIEGVTGKRAYNLSICAAQAPASYFLLRRGLEAGAKPSAILVDYK